MSADTSSNLWIHAMLAVGDPVPWFIAQSSVSQRFAFDTVAGRYVALTFLGSLENPAAAGLLREVVANGSFFDGRNAAFFGVCSDAGDSTRLLTTPQMPPLVYFMDFEKNIARGYGLLDETGRVRPTTFVLSENLRILAILPLLGDGTGHCQAVMDVIRQQPPIATLSKPAPILILDRVLEPELCQQLIAIFESKDGFDSGFMRDIDGKTTGVLDYSFKRRTDCEIEDPAIIEKLHHRLQRRVVPEIRKAYNFHVTRIERHLIACYDGSVGGHFRPHRDNTSLGTAHRRFAVSINLNAEDYDGGNLRFPEYGPATYRPTTGGAVVFGCSVLHEATPVTRGRRFAFLPFLYDDAAAQIREQNRKHIAGESINLNQA